MYFSSFSRSYYCIIYTFTVLAIFIKVHNVYGEIYQFTDKQGIIHLTDNPKNIPESVTSAFGKTSKLSLQDKIMLNELMNRGTIEHDFKFASLEEMKQGLAFLRESLRTELIDPEELGKPLDPRLASPEDAIALYRESLRSGNLKDLKACTTNRYWRSMEPEFRAFGKEKMATIEKEIFSHAEIRKIEQNNTDAKFELVRLENGNKMIYPISVVNAFGNWKISSI